MEFKTYYISPDIKLSYNNDKIFSTEVLFEFHVLVWLMAGETKIIQAGVSYTFKPGDIFLIPRNRLTTVINSPLEGQAHKAVAMMLSVSRLRAYYASLEVKPLFIPSDNKVIQFKNHPLLESVICSLAPYFNMQEELSEQIASLKIGEALTILRTLAPEVDRILANFETPGKIDLAKFMETHFMFNISLQKFGHLTGRSLSTFNRDFRKIFATTPQKWLTKKRLELAHQEITAKMRKPIEVYPEVGFEDLSHFSYAFKKLFGYPPTAFERAQKMLN